MNAPLPEGYGDTVSLACVACFKGHVVKVGHWTLSLDPETGKASLIDASRTPPVRALGNAFDLARHLTTSTGPKAVLKALAVSRKAHHETPRTSRSSRRVSSRL